MIDLRKLSFEYTVSLIGTMILMIGVVFALDAFAGIDPPSVTGFIAVVVASIWPANRFAERQGRVPTSGEAWRIALVLTGIAFILNAVLVAIWMLLDDGLVALLDALNASVFVVILAIAYLICIFGLRFSFPSFVKSALKAKAKGE